MPDFNIKGYTIQSQEIYDVLKNHDKLSETSLKKLDKNNDKKIDEDELVELLMDDDEEEGDKKTSDDNDSSSTDTTMKQIMYYQEQIDRLQDKINDKTIELGKCKDVSETSSVVSEIESLQSQIDSNYNQIYQLLVNKELKEEQEAAANGTSTDSTASAGEAAAASAGASEGTSYTATGKIGNTPSPAANYALQYDGKGASEMQKIMQNSGCAFHSGAWCADFATFATKMSNNGKTPHNFAETCPNTASCSAISSWARKNNLFTTDLSQVKAGDFILYGSVGSERHIGIVTAVNSDGTVDTIEGNTSDDNGNYTNGVVNQHHHVKNWCGFVIMH